MALPKITPYSYREQEHQNRVNWRVDPLWNKTLGKVSEGHQTTLGAYNRPWK